MKAILLSAVSSVAIAVMGVTTTGNATVKRAVALAEQRASRFQPNGHAEMWQVYTGDGTLEHVYIKIPGGCTGPDGKKIRDPKTGKVIETWGFYFRGESDHGHKRMSGHIEAPDSMDGQGTQRVQQGADLQFDQALLNEIRISMKHVPTYTWGDKAHKRYVCYDWASDMWNSAFEAVYGSV